MGQLALQIGTYFKTNLTENVDNSGNVTLSFFSVQFNVGRFAADFFNNLTTNLQTFTKGAEGVADALTQPLINQPWASGLTAGGLMNTLGYNDTAQGAQALADTILASNQHAAPGSGADLWVYLGNFNAKVQPAGSSSPLLISSSAPFSLAETDLANAPKSYSFVNQLNSIPGLRITLNDPNQLFKLITGQSAILFNYTPTVTVTAPGGTYNGNPFAATATVTGIDGSAAGTLEGVTPTLAYYAGSTATGTVLAAHDRGRNLHGCGFLRR